MKAVMKEKRNHRTIIFPFAREKLSVSHRVEQSLTYNRRRAVNAARKKGKHNNEQNNLIFSNGCFLWSFTTAPSRVVPRLRLRTLEKRITISRRRNRNPYYLDRCGSFVSNERYSLLALYEL